MGSLMGMGEKRRQSKIEPTAVNHFSLNLATLRSVSARPNLNWSNVFFGEVYLREQLRVKSFFC